MHRESKLLMLQLALITLNLLPFTHALTTTLPDCYVDCAKSLSDNLACDLTKSDGCTCSQSFLDALGCCIVDECWVSHSGATFRIPCGDDYQTASCPSASDKPSSSTATKSSSATSTGGGMNIMATPTDKDDDSNESATATTATTTTASSVEHSLIAATAGTELPTSFATSDPSATSPPGPDAGTIGLGVGLGLGIPAILVAIGLVAFFYRRGRRPEIEERQRRILDKTPSHHRSSPPSTLVDVASASHSSQHHYNSNPQQQYPHQFLYTQKSGPSSPGSRSVDATSNGGASGSGYGGFGVPPPKRGPGGPSNGNGTPLMVELPA